MCGSTIASLFLPIKKSSSIPPSPDAPLFAQRRRLDLYSFFSDSLSSMATNQYGIVLPATEENKWLVKNSKYIDLKMLSHWHCLSVVATGDWRVQSSTEKSKQREPDRYI